MSSEEFVIFKCNHCGWHLDEGVVTAPKCASPCPNCGDDNPNDIFRGTEEEIGIVKSLLDRIQELWR